MARHGYGKRTRLRLSESGSLNGGSPFGRDPSPRSQPFILLGITLAVGIALGVLHNHWRAQNKPDPVLSAVRLVLYPFQNAGAASEGGIGSLWAGLFRGHALQAENQRLTAEVDRLRQENETLHAKAEETDRLRAAVGLVRTEKKPPLAASVIAWLPSPQFDTISIARGDRDGVQDKMVARTPDGLVGQVIDTSPFTSEVMLLTDVNSGVGGLVKRKGKMQGVGIVRGTGRRGQPLEMVYLKREADVKPGDTVVSSGYGGVVPADVPIGTIAKVTNEDARFLKSAEVVPAAPMPGDLREVFLLR